ncbi:MAG: 6-phosphogluconolactonase [Flavobacteriaceae bacterium]|nr:MAG: 6-phosphogluconolactonase [Flavobacteriaceae bacterium]
MKTCFNYLSLGIVVVSLVTCNTKKKETVESPTTEISTPIKIELLVGTYTDQTSKGIYKLHFNPADGSLSKAQLIAETVSPSYLTISKNKEYVYATNETKDGGVSSFKWNAERTKLNLVSSLSSEGAHPCYTELSEDESIFAIANYSSGNFAVYKTAAAGKIQEIPQTRQHAGSSIVIPNQETPKAHCIKFSKDNTLLYVADLGIDEIVMYPVDANGTLGDKQLALKMDAGDGPRHFIYHPTKNIVFMVNELSSSVTAAAINATTGVFEKIDKQSTLPDGFNERNACADIHITKNGKFLYASNRGHNSIAVFSVAENGTLKRLETTHVEGDWPRSFALSPDEKFLLVANKNTDNITVFSINQETGLLTFTGNEATVSRPVRLSF